MKGKRIFFCCISLVCCVSLLCVSVFGDVSTGESIPDDFFEVSSQPVVSGSTGNELQVFANGDPVQLLTALENAPRQFTFTSDFSVELTSSYPSLGGYLPISTFSYKSGDVITGAVIAFSQSDVKGDESNALLVDFSSSSFSVEISLVGSLSQVTSLNFAGMLSFFCYAAPFNHYITGYPDWRDIPSVDNAFNTWFPSTCQLIIETDTNKYEQALIGQSPGQFDFDNIGTYNFSSPTNVKSVKVRFIYTNMPTSAPVYWGRGQGGGVFLVYANNPTVGIPGTDLGDLNGTMENIHQQLQDLANVVASIHNVDNSAILNYLQLIYQKTENIDQTLATVLSTLGSMQSLLNSMNISLADMRQYMTTMLNTLVSTMNSNTADIVAVIREVQQLMQQYFEEQFGQAGGEEVQSGAQELEDAVLDYGSKEDEYFTQAGDSLGALDWNFSYSDSMQQGFLQIGNIFERIWQALGEYKAVYFAPLLLALALVIVGRLSRNSHRSSSRGGG